MLEVNSSGNFGPTSIQEPQWMREDTRWELRAKSHISVALETSRRSESVDKNTWRTHIA